MATRYDAWFTQSDVVGNMKALQIYPAAGDLSPDGSNMQSLFDTQCGIAADAVKADFERQTGRKPFLATRATLNHTATTPNGLLMLLAPAMTIHAVTVQGSIIDPSLYWTMPETTILTGDAIDSIQFSQNYFGGRIWTKPQQIAVDADYGYCTTIPADVWGAGLNMAALYALMGIQGEQDMGSIGEDGFNMSFDLVGPIDDKVRKDLWPKVWKNVMKRYTVVAV